jgi:hypothetical protein
MTKHTLNLGTLKIPMTEYASQGNAILGIRDSGKSYTATFIAEQLAEANIPFIAFDPIGIWKYLRVPDKGPGYPIVIAGGRNGDLPLTPQSAPEIVRAAMKNGVSLVLDLYDMSMSKADWKSIVENSVRLLLYENGDYGLRHIFIEEAAEFVPQRVGPDQGRVYAEIEKLARMGGNALLGYTLINQRAEEVNKAVLELCDCLFLHRQKGRNSLQALTKWLDIGTNGNSTKDIIQSLPTLPQGECYVWASGSLSPERVKIPRKNTFHPDRRLIKTPSVAKDYKALDVSAFVTEMSAALEKQIQTAKENDPKELKREIARLQKLVSEKVSSVEQVIERMEVPVINDADIRNLQSTLEILLTNSNKIIEIGEGFREYTSVMDEVLAKVTERILEFQKMPAPAQKRTWEEQPVYVSKIVADIKTASGLTAPQQRILNVLSELMNVGISQPLRNMVAFLSSQSPRSSGFKNNLGALRSLGLINYLDADHMEITQAGLSKAAEPLNNLDADAFQTTVLRQLPAPQARILEVLIERGQHPVERELVAKLAQQSPLSSGFKNNLGALRSLGLLDYAGPEHVKALPMLWLE